MPGSSSSSLRKPPSGRKEPATGGTFFRNAVIQRAFLRYATRQRLMNVYLANIPGPPVSLYLAGAPLLEVFPMVPILGNVSLGIGALSSGQFKITVVADHDGCPDAGIFVEGIRASLDELSQPVAMPS
jgi:diacylglycerol O-acyltransferase